MPRLILRLFGPPRIELNNKPVATDRRKALALLLYLAVNGLAYSREALAALLWPDHDTTHALSYLRRTLWEIGQAIGDGWLLVERDTVGWRREARQHLWVDVHQFAACLEQSRDQPCLDSVPRLSEAIGLYTDDFLAGFNLKDALPFDDWALMRAESLRHDLTAALARLARCRMELGQGQEALRTARRWAELDPLDEAAHALIMQLQVQAGQLSAALKQYDVCAQTLDKELHTTPSAETTALYREIRAAAGKARPSEPSTATAPAPARRQLPASPSATAFFGREAELVELAQLLREPIPRLVTLIGPGGVGKTRLALEAARRSDPAFLHGTCFVPLASVARPEYVPTAIADAAGFSFGRTSAASDPRTQHQQFLDFLAGRDLLLILDNLEHLLAVPTGGSVVTSLITGLLAAVSHLKIMVTSHERLNVQEEWVLPIQGMPAPAADAPNLEQYSAVQLFIQNARKATVNFQPDQADRRAIARICQLLGGLPLGLELAAAWVKMLSCPEIAQEIERNADFLRTPLRNVTQRHQSLRATFEYSWRLLTDDERVAFTQLSVFSGGFRREAARAVADASLPILTALVDKSLLFRQDAERFDMHPALKPFALEKLAADPARQSQATADHGRFYAGFMQQRLPALHGRGQQLALAEIASEIENVRLGWQWAAAQGTEGDVQAYLEGLFRYYDIRGGFYAAEDTFGRAVAQWRQRAGGDNVVYGLLLACHGWFCNRLSRIAQAHALLSESLRLLRRLDAQPQLMFVNTLALYVVPATHAAEMARIAEESLAYYRAQNDAWGMAQVLPYMHRLRESIRLAEAIRQHEEAIRILRETGDAVGLAVALSSQGGLLHFAGDYAGANHCHRASLAIAREINDRRAISLELDYIGFIERQMGNLAAAREQHEASLALSRELGDQLGVAGSLDNLGLLAYDQEDFLEALRLFQEALALRRQSGQVGAIALSLEHVGGAALALDDRMLAETALHEALALYARDPDWALASRVGNRLGDLARRRGNLDEAGAHYRETLQYSLQHGNVAVALESVLALAHLAAAEGGATRGVELAALVQQHAVTEFPVRRAAQRLLLNLSAALPVANYASVVAAARHLTLDQVAHAG